MIRGFAAPEPEDSPVRFPDDAGQDGLGIVFDQDPAFSNLQGIEGLSSRGIEGVLHKGLNGRQHAGYQLLIMNDSGIRSDVME